MTDITRDFAWVLAQVLDGVKEHDLTDQFGIPEDECAKVMSLLAQARTYLAKPEPEGPTDEELEDFALQNGGGYFNCDCQAEADILTRKHVSNYRAVLARWGK